jgi:hypothetical protein
LPGLLWISLKPIKGWRSRSSGKGNIDEWKYTGTASQFGEAVSKYGWGIPRESRHTVQVFGRTGARSPKLWSSRPGLLAIKMSLSSVCSDHPY